MTQPQRTFHSLFRRRQAQGIFVFVGAMVITCANVGAQVTFETVQVNVDADGLNVIGDAANGPSLAIDPHDPNRIVIAWRQFDDPKLSFPTASWAVSDDSGNTWTVHGPLQDGERAVDPMVDVDSLGNFFLLSLQPERGPGFLPTYLYKSIDGGVSWQEQTYSFGGVKPWMTIDRTGDVGNGHIYLNWDPGLSCCTRNFTRSIDSGATFITPVRGGRQWGTISVGPDGEVYVSGVGIEVVKSTNARDSNSFPTFGSPVVVDLGGEFINSGALNLGGLMGRIWITTNHAQSSRRGQVYLLTTIDPPGDDPADVMFSRSVDSGVSWSAPVRVNDDPVDSLNWQWLSSISVAPSGRIDTVWFDTRNSGDELTSEVFYAYSTDAGETWSPSVRVSRPFDSTIGAPEGFSLGDSVRMNSDVVGVSVTYAATFNDEQDIFFLRIALDCNGNGVHDGDEIDADRNLDCNGNDAPDDCDISSGVSADENADGIPDECEPTVIYVDNTAFGHNDGTSWFHAFVDLNDAISRAVEIDADATEIRVAQGTYFPGPIGGLRTNTFRLVDNVSLIGGFSHDGGNLRQRDPSKYETILSGDIDRDDDGTVRGRRENVYHVVTADGVGAMARLDGFTIRAGNANGSLLESQHIGGGIILHDSAPNISSCRIVANRALVGGGMGISSGARPEVIQCKFVANSAIQGGAVSVHDSSIVLRLCIFQRNTASRSGGAIALQNSTATLISNVLSGNEAIEQGGALWVESSNSPVLTNCTIFDNVARVGGGISASLDVHPVLINCILWNNIDDSGNNEVSQIFGGTPTINYSCVRGLTGSLGGIGNISTNPKFVDADGEDDVRATADDNLRLSGSSPCIDAGKPDFFVDAGQPDLDGHGPVLCDRVDMGAYEFGIGDFNCDRVVNVFDIASWSSCMGGPGPNSSALLCEEFDFDFDARIDLVDYATFQTLLKGSVP